MCRWRQDFGLWNHHTKAMCTGAGFHCGFLFQVFLSCLFTLTSSVCPSSPAPCCLLLLLWALIPFLHLCQKSSLSACVSLLFYLSLRLIVSCFRHRWFTWTKMFPRIPRMFSMLGCLYCEPWQVERSQKDLCCFMSLGCRHWRRLVHQDILALLNMTKLLSICI